MELVYRKHIEKQPLPGRVLQKAVGWDSAVGSEKMTVSFARYSAESGPMEPHNHAEETVVILDADRGWVRRGSAKDALESRQHLEKDTVLHFDELEWHVFEYDNGGFVDAVCIYGQVDNIRPEDIRTDTD